LSPRLNLMLGNLKPPESVAMLGAQGGRIADHLLRNGTTYHHLGSNYFDERDRQATLRRTVHPIQPLGYRVTLQAA